MEGCWVYPCAVCLIVYFFLGEVFFCMTNLRHKMVPEMVDLFSHRSYLSSHHFLRVWGCEWKLLLEYNTILNECSNRLP